MPLLVSLLRKLADEYENVDEEVDAGKVDRRADRSFTRAVVVL